MDYRFQQKSTKKLEESIEETLKECLDYCIGCFSSWDLLGLYKGLRALRRVVSLMIEQKRFDQLNKEFEELEKLKRELDKDNKDEKKANAFFNKADKIFVAVGKTLKEENLIFSKNDIYSEGVDDEAVYDEGDD